MIHYNSIEISNSEDLCMDQFVESLYEIFDIEVTELKYKMSQNELEKSSFYSNLVVKLSVDKNLPIWDYGSFQLHGKIVA